MSEASSTTPVELLRALTVLAEPPGPAHARVADALGFSEAPAASDFGDVFLFQLYPYASVHVGAEGMMGGDARQRVAGFWRALGRTPPAEPDHRQPRHPTKPSWHNRAHTPVLHLLRSGARALCLRLFDFHIADHRRDDHNGLDCNLGSGVVERASSGTTLIDVFLGPP